MSKLVIPDFKLVIVESPFAGDENLNLRYLRACMRDCLLRGEAPYASHGLYTQPGVLNDDIPEERRYGMAAGFAFRKVIPVNNIYVDFGVSSGMQEAIEQANEKNDEVNIRRLPEGLLRWVYDGSGLRHRG